ncbi:MFS transporter [Altererythrobacter salegens]|uniref:MFS transporter n=1 Tax=Croceibacterium salegens TaxID=1737568 RepID=A0A6I4SVE2_9SPHN|nr:MFS transporter [Croceibacterium salegens]MXO60094.1 MFS transporter [Croceibacterium salegens]
MADGIDYKRMMPLMFAVFVNIAGFSLILPLLPFYGPLFGAGPFEVALLFAAYSLGNVFGEIYWGRQSDKHGRRAVLIVTTAGAALTYVAFAFVPSLWLAIAVRVVNGFFGGTLSVAQGFLADASPPEKRAKAMGLFGSSFSVGFAFGPVIGGLLAGTGGSLADFRAPILAAAALCAITCVWSLAVLRNAKEPLGKAAPLPRYSEGLHYVTTHPTLLRLFVISFFGIAAFASMEAVYGLWSEANFGWTARDLGFAFIAIGMGGLVIQLFFLQPLVTRLGEGRVIALGLFTLAASMLLQPILREPYTAVALMGLLMMGHSLAFPTAGALTSRTVPVDRQGSVMGFLMASNAFSRIVAPPTFGLIYEFGHDLPWYAGAVMIALIVPLALQLVALAKPSANG